MDHAPHTHSGRTSKHRPPRCPPYLEAKSADDLLPYFEAVAKREFSPGLWAAWNLQKGERVLLRVDSWHHPMCVEAAIKTLEKFGCRYELINADRGPAAHVRRTQRGRTLHRPYP